MTTNDDTERIPEHAFFGQATRQEPVVTRTDAAMEEYARWHEGHMTPDEAQDYAYRSGVMSASERAIYERVLRLEARVDALTAALMPFAGAASDPDVANALDSKPVLIEYAPECVISIVIDWNETTQEELKVSHLRTAANVLKGGAK